VDQRKICIQYLKKLQNKDKALKAAMLKNVDVEKMKVSDYELKNVEKDDVVMKRRVFQFIREVEYLGKPNQRTTHMFVAMYKDHIAGVVTFSTPNAFSHILGKENTNIEKLISRGATSAIACKNLGTALNAFAINWMVKNTPFRVFTAYSDPAAGELGTIYKALNFIYLGKGYGRRIELYDLRKPDIGWFSDRETRKLSFYKRTAKKFRIEWDSSWHTKWRVNWDKMPDHIELLLKGESKRYVESCEKRKPPRKHKWVYIKGRTRRETNYLTKKFKTYNPKFVRTNGLGLPYPDEKERGK
jgi:hypothetical protein